MEGEKQKMIIINLDEYKLYMKKRPKIEFILQFQSPSRKFYLGLIALVIIEMKRENKITFIKLERYSEEIILLNETVGELAGSSEIKKLLRRIYRKWKGFLSDLENAPLFNIHWGKKVKYIECKNKDKKIYKCTQYENDKWTELFDYRGCDEEVSLSFRVDKLGLNLDNLAIKFGGDKPNSVNAWNRFLESLKAEFGTEAEGEKKTKPIREKITIEDNYTNILYKYIDFLKNDFRIRNIPLFETYKDVVNDDIYIPRTLAIEEGEKFNKQEIINCKTFTSGIDPIIELVKDKRRILIEGEPGMGKTVLLNHIALTLSLNYNKYKLIPMIVPLYKYSNHIEKAEIEKSLFDYAKEIAAINANFEPAEKNFIF